MRNEVVVEKVEVTPFITEKGKTYKFSAKAEIHIWVTRKFKNGSSERAVMKTDVYRDFETDGASTFWPITLLVPHWREGDDRYNAGPVVHDILYIRRGAVMCDVGYVSLSREECDDILRGVWRCWGMSRFLAGSVDKAVELFAGCKHHWGNDGYNVKDKCSITWTDIGKEPR